MDGSILRNHLICQLCFCQTLPHLWHSENQNLWWNPHLEYDGRPLLLALLSQSSVNWRNILWLDVMLNSLGGRGRGQGKVFCLEGVRLSWCSFPFAAFASLATDTTVLRHLEEHLVLFPHLGGATSAAITEREIRIGTRRSWRRRLCWCWSLVMDGVPAGFALRW